MTYEELQILNDDLNIKEMDLSDVSGLRGLYLDGNIAIDKNMSTTEKACVLAEELGHHYTSTGNILDLSDVRNRKQELHARLHGYNRMIGLMGIISAYKAHCQNLYEMAEHLHISEWYLSEALEQYRQKYGNMAEVDNYIIMFEPYLAVIERFE